MIKTVIEVEGMYCGMCESHINDIIRNNFPNVDKVTSSRKKGETTFISEEEVDQEKLKGAIQSLGYQVNGIHTEPYEKKKWF